VRGKVHVGPAVVEIRLHVPGETCAIVTIAA
jgi:hypothetical protein